MDGGIPAVISRENISDSGNKSESGSIFELDNYNLNTILFCI